MINVPVSTNVRRDLWVPSDFMKELSSLPFLQTWLLALTLGLCLLAGTAVAQTPAGKPDTNVSQSPKIQLMLDLLGDEDVQSWVKQQRQQAAEKQPEPDLPAAGITLVNRLGAIQSHLVDIIKAVPRLPGELGRAMDRFAERAPGYGPGWLLALVAAFSALGALAVWMFDRLSAAAWRSLEADRPADPSGRFRLIGRVHDERYEDFSCVLSRGGGWR